MNIAYDHASQIRRLISVFFVWKLFLFFLAALSPGPGYDTSSLVLLRNEGYQEETTSLLWSAIDRVTLRLFRWDAVYFVTSAQRGYSYEQEWAFSWVYSHVLLRSLGQYIPSTSGPSLESYIWAGIILSNLCHLISVLVLYRLLSLVIKHPRNGLIPFLSCVLHILSPSSLFLSAPYAEAMFSMLNFTGMLQYVLAQSTISETVGWTIYQDAYILSSGILFALASLVRSNGLLSGLILLYDVVLALPDIITARLSWNDTRRIGVTCVAGSLIAVGFIMPQFLAYNTYCKTGGDYRDVRPWCNNTPPSVYSWVQSHYWNVGFLRYWTLSNLPLFVLATPMIWILVKSSVTVLRTLSHPSGSNMSTSSDFGFPQLALPQLVLAIAAVTSFHVQVITRLSSGYPMWYPVIANWIVQRSSKSTYLNEPGKSQWVVRGIIVYAIVQGLLFSNFLPPA